MTLIPGVTTELRRQDLDAAAGEYVADLIAEVGEPTPHDRARARAIARRLRERADTRSG